MRKTIAALAVVGALGLTGCAGAPSNQTPTARTYATAAAVEKAFIAAGGKCSHWVDGDASGPWAQYGNCEQAGDADGAVLSTYTSDSDKQSSIDGVKSSGHPTLKQLLVGPNWIIQAADVTLVQKKLGGIIVTVG